MVIRNRQFSNEHGYAMADLTVAIAIIGIALFPLAFSIKSDARLFKATYQRAVAMEIVDGEIEVLAAGAWRQMPEGVQRYEVHANAATNLPAGQFQLTRTGNHLRLEWNAAKKSGIGPVIREINAK